MQVSSCHEYISLIHKSRRVQEIRPSIPFMRISCFLVFATVYTLMRFPLCFCVHRPKLDYTYSRQKRQYLIPSRHTFDVGIFSANQFPLYLRDSDGTRNTDDGVCFGMGGHGVWHKLFYSRYPLKCMTYIVVDIKYEE